MAHLDLKGGLSVNDLLSNYNPLSLMIEYVLIDLIA